METLVFGGERWLGEVYLGGKKGGLGVLRSGYTKVGFAFIHRVGLIFGQGGYSFWREERRGV